MFAAQATNPALTALKLGNRHAITVRTGWSLGLGGGFYDEVWGPETLHSLLEYRQGLLDLPCLASYLRDMRLPFEFLFDILHNTKLVVPVTVPNPGQRLGRRINLVVIFPSPETPLKSPVRGQFESPAWLLSS